MKIPIEQQGRNNEHIFHFVKRVMKGDIDAFEKIVELYQKRLFKIAYKMVGRVEDARDILQEAFIKIFKNIHKLKAVREPFPYFCRITINVCMDWLRRERIKHLPLDNYLHILKGKNRSSYPSPELLMHQREKEEIITESLHCLTHRERAALSLRDLEGHKTKEVAAILGCSQATVRSHIASARLKMKEYLLANYPELKRENL